MYKTMMYITMVPLYIALIAVIALDAYGWLNRFIEDRKLSVEKAGWEWLHQQIYTRLGINVGAWPSPAVMYYIVAICIICVLGVTWPVSIPVGVVAGVVLHRRHEHRKGRLDQ